MANKKKNSPADDLINQLLDDVNNIDTLTSASENETDENPFMTAQRGHVDDVGIGMSPNKLYEDDTRNSEIPLWESMENQLSDEATGKSSPFDVLEETQVPQKKMSVGLAGEDGAEDQGFTKLNLENVDSYEPVHKQKLKQVSQQRKEIAVAENLPKMPAYEMSADDYDADDFTGLPKVVDESSDDASEDFVTPEIPEMSTKSETESDRTVAIGVGGDKTEAIGAYSPAFSIGAGGASAGGEDNEATVAANGFAGGGPLKRTAPQEKVVIGSLKGQRSGNVLTAVDASLAQAESLKIAQQRILELEKENDKLRQENEELASAGDIVRTRSEQIAAKIQSLEKEKEEAYESYQSELMILKGNLAYKESESAKARLKIEELESRLKNDFKKIRVRERELENRLELARAEKSALVRAKDDNILELKRKVDQMQGEIDNYREKCLELNKTIEANQEQFKRTVRALKLALTNLEVKEENIVPLKKAE